MLDPTWRKFKNSTSTWKTLLLMLITDTFKFNLLPFFFLLKFELSNILPERTHIYQLRFFINGKIPDSSSFHNYFVGCFLFVWTFLNEQNDQQNKLIFKSCLESRRKLIFQRKIIVRYCRINGHPWNTRITEVTNQKDLTFTITPIKLWLSSTMAQLLIHKRS